MKNKKYFDREISWLSFNYRVLQEAKDDTLPIYERLKFLAIFSNNLEEFFKVRVATIKSLADVKRKSQKELLFNHKSLLKEINSTVKIQQLEFGDIFRNSLIPELKKSKIHLIDNHNLREEHVQFLDEFFEENIQQHIQPMLLVKNKISPFLKNKRLYLVVRLTLKQENSVLAKKKKNNLKHAIVEIPSNHLSRFVTLPKINGEHYIIFLDDIIRHKLRNIFEAYNIVDSYSIKITRDAELYLEDEYSGNMLSKILKHLNKRETGIPSRFLYDENMPKELLTYLKSVFNISSYELSQGGKYHNFSDFFSFPNPVGSNFESPIIKSLYYNELFDTKNIFELISKKDYFFYFPYHSFNHIIKFLNDASVDPDVTTIKLTQYRVAKNSKVLSALIKAANNKKNVIVFVELKARFDEHANILWADEMQKYGIDVYYSFPEIKVHSKLLLVTRKEGSGSKNYAYFGTGNFNESTANIYTDLGLLTSHDKLTDEAELVFNYLFNNKSKVTFNNLLVARFNMRKVFLNLIDNEIAIAKKGGEAKIILKMNSLQDRKMIDKLYEASCAGVNINIIVRGICCLIPGVKGLSENISVISIVDQFLEHARIFVFYNNGNPLIYSGSADWMYRNLKKRIEVIFPIYDEEIKKDILEILQIQLKDNVKARIIDKKQTNKYKSTNDEIIRSQLVIYDYLKDRRKSQIN